MAGLREPEGGRAPPRVLPLGLTSTEMFVCSLKADVGEGGAAEPKRLL